MDCPECGTETVGFRVPGSLREYAPDGAAAAAICPRCLALLPADEGGGDLSRILDGFPEGEAGAAMALAVGLLVESVALNRDAVAALFERVEEAGTDPWLVLERLAASPAVDPDGDLDRLGRQLEQLS